VAKVLGLIFSARPGGNLADMAELLFAQVKARLPEVETELIEASRLRISPCNGCAYECLLGPDPGRRCPIEDDVAGLWRSVFASDLTVYFLPTYGGMPPATWVAFQQRFHGLFRLPEAVASRNAGLAAVTTYEPDGAPGSDYAQRMIRETLGRKLVCCEQIIPSAYGLNALQQRLVQHREIQARLTAMSDRLVAALQREGVPASV
jgi:multimeric flavodoxin WrbA